MVNPMQSGKDTPVNATRFFLSWGDPLTCLYLHLNGQYHLLTPDGGVVPLTFIPADQNPTGKDVLAFPVGIGPSAPATS